MRNRGQRKTQQPDEIAGLLKVEAAGIEPASGSLPPFDPTCVVRGLGLGPEAPTDGIPEGRSWKISPPGIQAHRATSSHFDGLPPTHEPRPGGPRARLC